MDDPAGLAGFGFCGAGYEMIPNIINDTYREFPDGRQICLPNKKGRDEYRHRREVMAQRQHWLCGCGCGERMRSAQGYFDSVSFQHDELRGKDRDDRILDEKGEWINCAMRYDCNVKLGSVRRLAHV